MKSRTSLAGAMALVIALSGLAGRDGEVLASSLTYEQSQDRAEFILLLRKARLGDSEAQWSAGATFLRLGEPGLAIPLLDQAAASGHLLAISQLGVLHEEGRGVAKSQENALDWYRKAADRGDPVSMAALARLLPSSDPKAADYRRQAALAGNADAQYALGLELAGRGEAGFLAESHEWFLKAAQQGHIGARIAVGQQLLDGKAVKRDVERGLEWLERAAQSGNPVANFIVAGIHQAKGGSSSEVVRKSLRIAASGEHREAQYLYGRLLADSKIHDDKREAAAWLGRAWATGHVAAANRLGELLREPVEGLQQQTRARELFLQAAEKGNVDAMYNFAEMQHAGVGGERDTFEALKWYGRAADGKHERAMEVVESLLGSTLKTSSLGLKGFWQ